ncbi:HACE1 ligase, partial [Polyodon spathula]|nr:HACE1 ligase [Polyodon spathula]
MKSLLLILRIFCQVFRLGPCSPDNGNDMGFNGNKPPRSQVFKDVVKKNVNAAVSLLNILVSLNRSSFQYIRQASRHTTVLLQNALHLFCMGVNGLHLGYCYTCDIACSEQPAFILRGQQKSWYLCCLVLALNSPDEHKTSSKTDIEKIIGIQTKGTPIQACGKERMNHVYKTPSQTVRALCKGNRVPWTGCLSQGNPQILFNHFHFLLESPELMSWLMHIIKAQVWHPYLNAVYVVLNNGIDWLLAAVDPEEGLLVRVSSSCDVVSKSRNEKLKQGIALRCHGEEGTGQGVVREWLDILSNEIINPSILLKVLNQHSTVYPTSILHFCTQNKVIYKPLTKIMQQSLDTGVVLENCKRNTDIYFTLFIYKHIFGIPVTYPDVASIFSVETDVFGTMEEVPLEPGRISIFVTQNSKGWAQETQVLPSDEEEANTSHRKGSASYMTVCEHGHAAHQETTMSAGREQGDEPEAASMWDENSARRDSSPEDTPSIRRHRITPAWRQAGLSIGSLEARGSSFRRRSTDEQLIRMEERILASQWQANTEMRGVMELILLEFRELNSILRQRLPPAPSPSGESSTVVDSSSQTE